jgi:branched-chain amino acid transport system substrate-binding protein
MQAVQLAVEKHNQTSQVQVRLITGDTEGGMIKTAQLTKDMLTASRVPVIIGPVLSSNAIVCASMLFEKNAVMITPTATDDGIGSLGSNVFQLNVTPATLGRRIAAYAMDNLMIRDFAVIAPSSDYGKVLAGGFIEEVKKRNAELVSEQYFEEGTKDFRTQFESLRRSLLEKRRHALALKKGLAYSPAPTAKEMRIDSARYADSTLSVGGLFIPAEAEDVVMLAPQAQFHRIQTQMLGSTGWHTQTTVRAGKQYVNNAIISTSAETDLKDSQWSDFSAAYKKRFGMEPDRVAAVLAWDAASLVLMAIDKYGDDVKEIANSLHSVRGYKGLSGPVSFGQENGTNTEAAIVKIKDGNFLKIQ